MAFVYIFESTWTIVGIEVTAPIGRPAQMSQKEDLQLGGKAISTNATLPRGTE